FQVKSHDQASIAQVRAASLKGSASGSTRVTYFDTIPPSAPQILSGVLEGDQASLVWKANREKDVAGYVIYYDTDTIAPFSGVHTVYGEPSPIVLGNDTTRSISGMLGDSVYYFAVSAYDVSGNESRRSPFISVRKDTTGTSVVFSLKAGWNILSFDHLPANKDLKEIFGALIKDGSLLKIQDEAGNTLEDFGSFGSWVNSIGELSLKEGYKVKVTRDCQLQLKGFAPSLPLEIPLEAGWNIIGYPRLVAANAQEVVQALIERGTLVKVQDEKGNSIEDWGLFGGWQNNIGNFERGKGYKVKVTSEDTLIISGSYTKAAVAANNDLIAPGYFKPILNENGVDHMNINLVGLSDGWLQPGDELGVFDGDLCIGAVSLIARHLSARVVSIPAPAADKAGTPGFTEKHPIRLKLWKATTGEEILLEPEIIRGSATFKKHESTFASLAKYGVTGSGRIEKEGAEKFTLYPNPTTGKFYLTTTGATPRGVTLQLLNGAGQLLREELMEERTVEVDLTGCARGVYYLKIKGEDETQVKKIVLQ
ncbi:MAG TPA: T9SS type A sorting domain-containing protein, partial [Prolixibacteraceae bacterium]|nr:T9SS type A sorting domain-containing protein [Prolixibacteraceae bacterium]